MIKSEILPRVRGIIIPSVKSRSINARVYKMAKNHISNKGFVVEPRIGIKNFPIKRNVASANSEKPLIQLNEKRVLEFLLFPSFLKSILNHEAKHIEQNVVRYTSGMDKDNFASLSLVDKHFYDKNAELVKLDDNVMGRAAKLIIALRDYPCRKEALKEYNELKNETPPLLMRPIHYLKTRYVRHKAVESYKKLHHANFLEEEAIASGKNNGSVFA